MIPLSTDQSAPNGTDAPVGAPVCCPWHATGHPARNAPPRPPICIPGSAILVLSTGSRPHQRPTSRPPPKHTPLDLLPPRSQQTRPVPSPPPARAFLHQLHADVTRLEFSHYDVDGDGYIRGLDFGMSIAGAADIKSADCYLDKARRGWEDRG
jgi:hypothetical protein